MQSIVLRDFCAMSFLHILSFLFKHSCGRVFLPKRIEDEDDEMAVIEQDVQRLVIVTQVSILLIYLKISSNVYSFL